VNCFYFSLINFKGAYLSNLTLSFYFFFLMHINKTSDLWLRRKTNPLLLSHNSLFLALQFHNSSDVESSLILLNNKKCFQDLELHVKTHHNRFTTLNILLYKIRYFLWNDIAPENTLSHSFFIPSFALTYLRQLILSVFGACFTWSLDLLMSFEANGIEEIFVYFTTCTLFTGLIYLLFTLLSQDMPNENFQWKCAYILGEINFTFGFFTMILSLFCLVNNHLDEKQGSEFNFSFYFGVSLFCLFLLQIEFLCNSLQFHQNHKICLYFLILMYLNGELFYFEKNEEAAYFEIIWTKVHHFVAKTLVISIILLGFSIGRRLYILKSKKY